MIYFLLIHLLMDLFLDHFFVSLVVINYFRMNSLLVICLHVLLLLLISVLGFVLLMVIGLLGRCFLLVVVMVVAMLLVLRMAILVGHGFVDSSDDCFCDLDY